MSAYLVASHHIAFLAQFASRDKWGHYQDPSATAAMLARANLASLTARYGDADDPAFVDACKSDARECVWTRFAPFAVIDAAECLEYQSCEVEKWESTEAARCLRAIKSMAVQLLRDDARVKNAWSAPEPDSRRLSPRAAAPANPPATAKRAQLRVVK